LVHRTVVSPHSAWRPHLFRRFEFSDGDDDVLQTFDLDNGPFIGIALGTGG